jgi:Protein of unknown function (DUF2585)
MREPATVAKAPRSFAFPSLWWWLATLGLLALTACELHFQGRRWWCACGHPWLWVSDAWGPHNSQHLFDPYSFTHVLHGVILCGLLALVWPRLAPVWGLWLTLVVEAIWEVIENSAFVIDRYRAATAALGYEGDSIANSLGDILSGGLGFLLARRLGLRWSIVFIVVTEVVLLFWIRDNLTLNIVMLIHPSQAVKTWQLGH